MKTYLNNSHIFFLFLIVFFSNYLFAQNTKQNESAVSKIEKEFIKKQIDVDTWAKLTCFALYDYKNLPLEYRSQYQDRSGTIAVKLLFERWEHLSESTKMSLTVYGFNLFGVMSRPSYLTSYIDTGHFRVHYSVAQGDTNAVSNWDFNNNGVPDYIDKVTDAFEHSWVTEIDSFLFYQPPSDTVKGGNDKYDVYIIKFSSSTYGLTYPEQYTFDNPNTLPIEKNAATSYIVIRNEYSSYSAGETGSINVTAAHEFFHAIQMGYDAWEKSWLMESTAAWIEDEVYDDVNDNRQYLSHIFVTPWIPLDATNTESNGHWYGSWIFFRYLSEHNGGTIVINSIWDKSIVHNSATGDFSWQAVSEGLADVGAQLNDEMTNFWIALMLKNYAEYSFEEADYYPPINISYNFWNNSLNSNVINDVLKRKSATVSRFSPALNFGGNDKITITFTPTNQNADLGVVFIKKTGTQYTIDKYPPKAGTFNYTINHSSNFDAINAIVYNTGSTTENYKIQVVSTAKLSKLTDDWNFSGGFLNSLNHYFYTTYTSYNDNSGNPKYKYRLNYLKLTTNVSDYQIFNEWYKMYGAKNSDDNMLVYNNITGGHNLSYKLIATNSNDTSDVHPHWENIWNIVVGNNEAIFCGTKITHNPFARDGAIWKINLSNGSTNMLYQYDDTNEYCSSIQGKTDNFIFKKITYSTPLKIDIIKHSSSGNTTLLTTIDGQGTNINATSYYDDTFAWIQYVDSIGGQQLKIKDLFFNSIEFEDDESDGKKIDNISLKTSSSGVIWAKSQGTTYNPHFWVYYFDGIDTNLVRYTNQFIMQNDNDSKRFALDDYGLAWMELDVHTPTNYILYYYRFSDKQVFSADMSNYFGRQPHLNILISKDYAVLEVNSNEGGNGIGIYLMKIDDIITGINDAEQLVIVNDYKLIQNYPNPFNPSTVISYTIGTGQHSPISKVSLKVYDILGREVITLVNKEQKAGNYKVSFNASKLASGVYFYRIVAGDFVQTKKMVLLK